MGDACDTTPYSVDNTITSDSTTVKATHIKELRDVVNAIRQSRGYANWTWAEALTKDQTLIRASHINEVRAAIVDLYI